VDERGERSVRQLAAEASSVATRASGAFATSIVVHGVLVLAMLALPSGYRLHDGYATQEVEIELMAPIIDVPPLPEPTIEPETLTPAPSTGQPRERPIGAVVETTTAGAQGELGPAPSSVPMIDMPTIGGQPSEPGLDPQERQRLGVLVDPRQAASSWVVAGSSGPSQPSGPAGLAVTGGRARLSTEAEVEGSLTGHLRGEAMARPWLRRTEPQLVPRPDGSLQYTGHAFTARIAPDGAVSFSDRDAVQADEMLQGGPARFDITDMAMRGAGQDPYAAEREWFMEHTEEVRARLETEARARERDSALRGVPGRLAAIWNQERPAFLRRRAIFRMWDDCDEEGDGLSVRRQVIEFVRSEIPQTGTDAFTVDELRRLNAERESTMEFSPY